MSKMKGSNKMKQVKARNWGNVTLHFKTGKGVHKDKTRYSRKAKHKNRLDK